MLWDPMESQGSLELLSSFFTHPSVRKYAVARLNDTSDEVRVSFTTTNNCLIQNLSLLSQCILIQGPSYVPPSTSSSLEAREVLRNHAASTASNTRTFHHQQPGL